MLNIFLFSNLLHYIVDYFSDVGNYKPVQNLNICIRDIYTNNDRISNYLLLRFYLLCNQFYLPEQLLGIISQESTSWTTLDRYHI